jgi:hypothetical protein
MTEENQAKVNPLSNGDRRVLAKEFAGKQFNDKVVADFCTRNKIAIADAGSVEDFIYQEEYDKRMATVTPLVLAKLGEMKYSSLFDTEQVKQEVLNFNDNLSAEIAVILEDNGVEYREIGLLKELFGNIMNIMNTAETRISNMCASVVSEIAQEKVGTLTIRALSLEKSQIADRKAKADGAVKSSIQKEDIQTDNDTPKAGNA